MIPTLTLTRDQQIEGLLTHLHRQLRRIIPFRLHTEVDDVHPTIHGVLRLRTILPHRPRAVDEAPSREGGQERVTCGRDVGFCDGAGEPVSRSVACGLAGQPGDGTHAVPGAEAGALGNVDVVLSLGERREGGF